MPKKMSVLFATSEAMPFAKTGGLADVSGSLPKYLKKAGLDTAIIMPKYRQIEEMDIKIKKIGEVMVNLSGTVFTGEIEKSSLPGTRVKVYFVKNDAFFHRKGLYGEKSGDYPDNSSRFIFFSRAVLEALKIIDKKPNIIHAHDWQTGLIPCYLKSFLYSNDTFYHGIKTVFTIHNLSYQGLFWHIDMPLTGLGWNYFTPEKLEFYGKISFLKAGLLYSDILTTVSPTYSKEIQNTRLGCGMEGLLNKRNSELFGILNGADYSTWDPKKDKLIPKNYSKTNIKGKSENKSILLEKFGLLKDDVPVISFIGRLVEQKGLELIKSALNSMAELPAKFIFLGTGNKNYEDFLSAMMRKYPDKISVMLEFSEKTAHLLQAGSDILIMPSSFEPCGLNQLYSMKYGTIPVAYKTGGLADSIIDFRIDPKNGTGFLFSEYTEKAMLETLISAIKAYDNKKIWKKLVSNCMSQDFSWQKASEEYIKIYKKII